VIAFGSMIVLATSLGTIGCYFSDTSIGSLSYEISIGVKKYQIVTSNSATGEYSSETGSITDMVSKYGPQWQRFDQGGTDVLGTGVVATIFAASVVALGVVHFTSKTAGPYMKVALALLILCAILVFIGVILYVLKLYVGWSYILFLIACLLTVGTVTLFIWSAFGSQNVVLKERIGVFLLSVVVILLIAAMASNYWVVRDISTAIAHRTLYVGLQKYMVTSTDLSTGSTSSVTGNLSGLDDLQRQQYIDGGVAVLGTGIVSLLLLVAAIVLIALQWAGKPGPLMFYALITCLAAAILIMIGVVLYARKLYVSYSFILFIATTFFFLTGAFIFYLGNSEADSPVAGASRNV